jgi:hypothetical protein
MVGYNQCKINDDKGWSHYAIKHYLLCHDPNLKLMTKAKAWKGAGRECNLRVTFALLRVWRNEPTYSQVDSQVDSNFGIWNPYGVLNFQKGISKVKIHWIKNFLYHWKVLER